MPRHRSPTLTDAELRLMNVLWTKGAATVNEVISELPGSPKPAYNTVLTLLRILEKKGYVGHRKHGRAFAFEPTVDERNARRSAVHHLLSRFFNDRPGLLVLNLLEDEKIAPEEVERLRRLIDDAGRAA